MSENRLLSALNASETRSAINTSKPIKSNNKKYKNVFKSKREEIKKNLHKLSKKKLFKSEIKRNHRNSS